MAKLLLVVGMALNYYKYDENVCHPRKETLLLSNIPDNGTQATFMMCNIDYGTSTLKHVRLPQIIQDEVIWGFKARQSTGVRTAM